jgi:hypothetical protein
MPVGAHPEQEQVMPVDRFAMLRGKERKRILVFLRRELRLDLAPHPQDRFLRNGAGIE